MKNHAAKTRAAVVAAAVTVMVTVALPARADDAPLRLPADLQPGGRAVELPGAERGARYLEQRIGGRLERVTVTRGRGPAETYRNNRADTIWRAPPNEIGERANMRQWIIRAW